MSASILDSLQLNSDRSSIDFSFNEAHFYLMLFLLHCLFEEFRDFAQKDYNGDISGYAAAMEKKRRKLKTLQNRLAAIDSGSWSVSEQIDYQSVRMSIFSINPCHQNDSIKANFSQIDHKRTSVFCPKTPF